MKKLVVLVSLFVLTLTARADTFAILGDGLSRDSGWPAHMSTLCPEWEAGEVVNYSWGGRPSLDAVWTYHLEAHAVAPHGHGWCVVWLGTMDLAVGCDPDAVYDNLRRLWSSARYDGYQVEVFTIAPNQFISRLVVDRLNALILSDASLYDGVCRVDLMFPNPRDWRYYSEPVRINALAHRLIAEWVSIDIGWAAAGD